jgi:photosystem II stability/assembly factor-like uncharacterized protein
MFGELSRLYKIMLVLVLINAVSAYAQIHELIGTNPGNFFEMRDFYYKSRAGKVSTDQKLGYSPFKPEFTRAGENHFKRWEYFWAGRVMDDGSFPSGELMMKAINDKAAQKALKQKSETKLSAQAEWKHVGPKDIPQGGGAGRINCIQLHPLNPSLIWAGAAAGGAWKSTDMGRSWSSSTDNLLSIGVSDIAIEPTDINTVYLATGDDDLGTTYTIGVMKSTDGGQTWRETGLKYTTNVTAQIYRLLTHPKINGRLWAATSGGLFYSADAGTTWTKKSDRQFRDLEIRTDNPNILFGCQGNIIYRSTDGGDNWVQSSTNIPNTIGRISIAISPVNQDYIYALCSDNAKNTGFGGVYRSIDGGKTWVLRSSTPNVLGGSVDGSDNRGQGWYDLTIACSYSNANSVIIGGINVWRSTDGANSWLISAHWYGDRGTPYVHADIHDLDFHPAVANLVIAGCDGGVFSSSNSGQTWQDLSNGLEIMQFYHISTSQTANEVYMGGAQDNGTNRFISSQWSQVLGGDGMKCLVSFSNPNFVYGAIQNGYINRSTDGGNNFQGVINPDITKEGGRWVTPYVFNPNNAAIMYAGFANVWRSTNSGASGTWTKITDFPSNSSLMKIIAVAPSKPTTIVAINDATIYITRNGGTTWETITTPTGAGPIERWTFSTDDDQKAWFTVSGFRADKVYKTTDGGQTWTNVSKGLPPIPTKAIVYEKNSPERLYIGNDLGVYYTDSTSDGWIEYSDGLPNTIVSDLEINYTTRKLVAGTYGRGLWTGNLVGCKALTVEAVASGKTVLCPGDSVVISAQEGFSSYRWSTGSNARSIVVKNSGNYSVTVTDAEGCTGISKTISVSVSAKPNARITAAKTAICPGDSVMLDAGLGFTEYLWSTGAKTQRITVKDSGSYTVTVKNNAGCEATSTPQIIALNPLPEKPVIIRDSNTLSSTVTGASYQWLENGTVVSGQNRRTYTPTQASLGKQITVRVTNASGCSSVSDPFKFTPLSVDEEDKSTALAIYPNPASGDFTLQFIPTSQEISISIVDASGQNVFSLSRQLTAGTLFREKINLTGFASGTYLIKIKDGVNQYTRTIVKL